MAELLSHSELDSDSDGSFTEDEAKVNIVFLCSMGLLLSSIIIIAKII